MNNIKVVKFQSRLETADDGDTCHYGGTFTLDDMSYYFQGNDRNASLSNQVLEELLPGEEDALVSDEVVEKLIDAIHERRDLRLVVEGRTLRAIEPT
jgi:hypothetical protein